MGDFGFILKQYISFFTTPFGMIVTLLLLGVFFKYRKNPTYAKGFFVLSALLLTLFSYQPFANFLVTNLEQQYKKYDYTKDIKYIHVLGSGHTTDEDQPISSQMGYVATKRVLEGVILYKNIKNTKLIFTGAEGDTDTPTAIMASRLALALGVKKKDIIIGPSPKDTKEEALFCKSILGDKKLLLVTSATHMARSMRLFSSLGLHPTAAPTDFLKDQNKFFDIFSTNSFYQSTVATHEYFGILWEILKEKFLHLIF